MASLKLVRLFLSALLHAIFLFSSSVLSDGDETGMVLEGLNSYRTFLGLPAFTNNENAECLAEKIAQNVLMDQQCNTRDNSVELENYPDLLSDCGIYINQTRDGAILPVCVATLVPTLVLTNYTYTQFANYITDWSFTGAGIGSEGDWMVVILSTNALEGSFGALMKDDEEDPLKSLNTHRAYLDLPGFIKNKEAGCLASEVAQKLGKKPCKEGANDDEVNGSSGNPYELERHPELLDKCDINITSKRDVVLLPICVPKLLLTDMFTDYTRTHYEVYINDFKFVEVGIRGNGDWMVLVLSTNTTLTERREGGGGGGDGDGGGDEGGGGGGFFVGANNSFVFKVGFGHYWVV